MSELLLKYGAISLFILSVIDHTGTPSPFILAIELKEEIGLSIYQIIVIYILASVTGDSIIYGLGRFVPIRNWISEKSLTTITSFENKYGVFSIIIGRFVPIIGRYIYLIFGITKFSFTFFLLLSFIGSSLMTFVFLGLTLYLSGFFPDSLPSWVVAISIVIIQIILFKLFHYLFFKIKSFLISE